MTDLPTTPLEDIASPAEISQDSPNKRLFVMIALFVFTFLAGVIAFIFLNQPKIEVSTPVLPTDTPQKEVTIPTISPGKKMETVDWDEEAIDLPFEVTNVEQQIESTLIDTAGKDLLRGRLANDTNSQLSCLSLPSIMIEETWPPVGGHLYFRTKVNDEQKVYSLDENLKLLNSTLNFTEYHNLHTYCQSEEYAFIAKSYGDNGAPIRNFTIIDKAKSITHEASQLLTNCVPNTFVAVTSSDQLYLECSVSHGHVDLEYLIYKLDLNILNAEKLYGCRKWVDTEELDGGWNETCTQY